MKRIVLFLLLVFVVVWGLFGDELVGKVTFDVSELKWEERDGFWHPVLQGCSYLYSEELLGAPEVLFKPVRVLLPPDAEVVDVEVSVVESEILPRSYNIYPLQRAVPFMKGEPFPFISPRADMYAAKVLFPDVPGRGVACSRKAGWQIYTLDIYPLQYVPGDGSVIFNKTVEYRIVYNLGSKAPRAVGSKVKDHFRDKVKRLVVNPEMVDVWEPPTAKLTTDSIDYVIITPEAWASALEPLREWKTKKGVRTYIMPLESIYANYTGVDNAEQVRNFIIDANLTWGSLYFLLVGQDDSDIDDSSYGEAPGTWCPRRDVFITSSGAGYYNDEDTIASDLYFADLDGDWNADGDGVWGESADNVDLYTDVYVGRVLAESLNDVQDYVTRVLDYEKDLPYGMVEKVLLTSENLFTGYNGELVSDSIDKYDPASFTEAKCYDEYGDYDDLAAIDSMEVGYMYVHHAGHGDEIGVMYGSGDPITVSDIEGYLVDNTNLYGIVIAISCWPGAFDYDSYAEHLQLDTGTDVGGAAACILNYRYGWGTLDSPGRSEWIDIWFFQSIFGTGSFTSEANCVAEALADAKDVAVAYRSDDIVVWCIYELNLYGDPELPLWTTEPETMVVSHDATVPATVYDFTVDVSDNSTGNALSGADVCLMCVSGGDTVAYMRGVTDAAGSVTLTVDLSSVVQQDTLWVTVTAKNYVPYEGYAVIQPGGVRYQKHIVSAGTVLDDGEVNPKETATLEIWVRNGNDVSESSVAGTLLVGDPNVSVTDGSGDFGTIVAGDSAYDYFQIDVGDVPDGYTFPCTLIVDYTGGGPDTSVFNITAVGVGVADVNVDSIVFDYTGVKYVPSGAVNNDDGVRLGRREILEHSSLKIIDLADGLVFPPKASWDTIQYDDGTVGSWWYGVDYWAVEFTPEAPCSVKGVFWGRYHEVDEVDTVWVKLDSNNDGDPDQTLDGAAYTLTATGSEVLYHATLPTGAEVDGDFWVCIYARTDDVGSNESYLLGDPAGGTRSYYSSDGVTWYNMACLLYTSPSPRD